MTEETVPPDPNKAPTQAGLLSILAGGRTTKSALADELGLAATGLDSARESLRGRGYDIPYEREGQTFFWTLSDSDLAALPADTDTGTDEDADEPESDTPPLPDPDTLPEGDSDPDPDELSDRQRVIVSELQTGSDLNELSERLDAREPIVREHIRDLARQGWQVYVDETAEMVAIEGDHAIRSSEHKGTRTRKANRWWEQRHNELVRGFRGLDRPTAGFDATAGHEDWVCHVTDLHAGDEVVDDAGRTVYATEDIPEVIDYITSQALSLAEKHGSTYDAAHLCWGGDFITNEGIYSGQFEDLDAWLDEQHDTLIEPLVGQLKAFSQRFPAVNVVCQVGNHGTHRASGTSRQANADLILYKSVRNVVAQLQDHAGLLDNVNFQIGSATPYKNFELRGGNLRGHLRHGQHRRPQAETSARQNEWRGTLLDHDFDVALMGHYHISGRIPWGGPPVIVSPSPKPAGEFVEGLGGRTPSEYEGVATAFGVSDDGLTSVFPIDTRRY